MSSRLCTLSSSLTGGGWRSTIGTTGTDKVNIWQTGSVNIFPHYFASADIAATKIQAGFKGMKVRQEMTSMKKAAAKIQAGFKGMKLRKEVSSMTEAAIKIQARFKGMTARKRICRMQIAATTIQAGFKGMKIRRELLAKQVAATKVQAGFKAFKDSKGGENDALVRPYSSQLETVETTQHDVS